MLKRFEQFSYVISGIYRYIQKIERDEMEKYGYRGSYAQYLVAINSRDEELTASRLSEICEKDKALVSRTITEMEQNGLIIRECSNGKLYRARLKLTKEGKAAAEYVCQRAKQAVEAVGKNLSDKEREVFYNTLDNISSNLEKISKEGIPKNE